MVAQGRMSSRGCGSVLLCTLVLWAPATASASDRSPPQIVHEPCAEYLVGEPIEILARIVDESTLFDPKVVFRSRLSEQWQSAPLVLQSGVDVFRATLNTADVRGAVEYFLEAFDENGNGPARYGAPDAPVRLRPSKRPERCQQVVDLGQSPTTLLVAKPARRDEIAGTGVRDTASPDSGGAVLTDAPVDPAPRTCASASRPFYCSPWFWGTAGALVAVGAGVGVWALGRSPQDDATPSSVVLNVHAPDPTTLAPVSRGGPR